ncbi:MAG: hypothetical protein IKN48_02020 [Bacteroidaceae bacterium]|nr:hypothetical protein [Bacteroidaceae bacterium]
MKQLCHLGLRLPFYSTMLGGIRKFCDYQLRQKKTVIALRLRRNIQKLKDAKMQEGDAVGNVLILLR